jgi:hypothetical protein
MSTRKRKSKVKLVGAFIIIAGALMVVAAGVTLGMVASELKAEHMTVSTAGPAGPASRGDADLFNAYPPVRLRPAVSQDVMTFPNTTDPEMNGSFLRALFLIAAIALGVAVPVMGVGVLFAVIGVGHGARKRHHH